MKFNLHLIVWASALHFSDIVFTLTGIAKFGIDIEGNPFVKNLIFNGQLWLWVLLKFIFLIVLLFAVYFGTKKLKKVRGKKKIILNIILTLACLFIFFSILIPCLQWILVLLFRKI